MRWLLTVALFGGLATGCARDSDSDGTPDKEDCEPGDPTIHPEARETCDGIDNNCNGQVDEDVAIVAYWDRDGDGYGDDEFVRRVCTMPDDGSEVGGDCDDGNEFVNPGVDELCDGLDNNCNGEIDDGALVTWYEDLDGDGHGTSARTLEDCSPPEGWAPADDDCDDDDPLAWTDAPELCDNHDNDCDDEIDEGLEATRVWADADGDGFGDPSAPLLDCGAKPGIADNDRDCDDSDPNIGPHVEDVQGNGLDEDCDGYVDEYGIPTPYATIEDALVAAPDGSVIQFDEGNHRVLLDLSTRDLTLAGEGCGRTVLLADLLGSVVTMANGAVEKLTITGGTGTPNPAFLGGRTEGGGLLVDGGTVAVREVCFEGNEVTKYGGAISVREDSNLILEDSRIVGNYADHQGGGVFLWRGTSSEVTRTQFLANEAAKFSGGALSTQGGNVTITNSVFGGNVSGDDGGAVAIQEDDDGVVTPAFGVVDQSTFHANQHGTDADASGAAVFARGAATLVVTDTLFTGHSQRRDVLGDEGGATMTLERLGFGDDRGADMRAGHDLDAARGSATYIFADPTVDADRWDLRLRPGSDFVDAGDPGDADLDGSPTDLGAFGGSRAPEDALDGFLDSDGDGIDDGAELRWGTNLWVPDGSADDDSDGLSNADEAAAGTDPKASDTDADGVDDATEQAAGTDPTNATDHAPTASAGPDRSVIRLNPVTLDAGGSWDPNGDPLTYTWTLESPELSGVADVVDPTAPSTTFTPDVDGDYTVTVTVSDGAVSRADSAVITAYRGWVVPDTAATIAEAITLAEDGDGIGLRPGVYQESVRISGKQLALIGIADDPSEVVIDAARLGVGVAATEAVDGSDDGLTLAMLTIRGGHGSEGGGVSATGLSHLHLQDVRLVNNSAYRTGGAVYADTSELTAIRTHFVDNYAENGGGLFIASPRALLDQCTFSGNEAVNFGGGLAADAESVVLLRNSVLSRNTAPLGAAAAAIGLGSTLRFDQSAMVDHRGGSLAWTFIGAAADLVGSVVSGNRTERVFDGLPDATWSAIGSIAHDNTGALWHDAAGPVSTTPAFAEVDPELAFVSLDDATDDVWAVRLGGASHDSGIASRTDLDGSRGDIGPRGVSVAVTDRRVADQDGDGLEDAWELAFGLDPAVPSAGSDDDGDGLDAAAEHARGTHPGRSDSDRDGVDDDADGSPTDEADHRPVVTVEPLELAYVGDRVTFTAAGADPDGAPVSLEWTVFHVPPGSSLADEDLSATEGTEVSFTADARGVYRLLVTADDGEATSRAIASVRVDGPIEVPGTFATLEEALESVSDGDEIALGEGTWELSLDYDGPDVLIRGAGVDATYLEALPAQRVLTLDAGDAVSFADLTMTGGSGETGGAVYCNEAELSLDNVRLEYNIAREGGAVYSRDCVLEFTNLSVLDNESSLAGGGMQLRDSVITWRGGEVARNRGTFGAGVHLSLNDDTLDSALDMANVVFHHNVASSQGGAIYMSEGILDAHNNTFVANEGTLGAIRLYAVETIELRDNVFVDNGIRGVYESGSLDLESHHNGFWGHTSVPGTPEAIYDDPSSVLDAEPRFIAYDTLADGGWFDDYRLRHDSGWRDVGSTVDPDGTASDLGAFGGEGAPEGFDAFYVDLDLDGMADGWELEVGLDPTLDDADSDPDGDGVPSGLEFVLGLDPRDEDSDGDGVSDLDEIDAGFDPSDPTDLGPVASAGDDVDDTPVGEEVALSGAASVDGDGDALAYSWSLVDQPGRSSLTTDDLAGSDTVTVRFTPDTPGLFVLQLVVEGGGAFSAPDHVAVHVAGDVLVPEDYGTLEAAVHAVVEGETVRIGEGVWPTGLDLEGKDVTLEGVGRGLTVLDGSGTTQVLRGVENEDLTIRSLTITNGFGANAGGIEKDGGALVLEDVDLTLNHGVLGGAVYASDVLLTAVDVSVTSNVGTRLAGGFYLLDGTIADISRALFADNACYEQFGGALQVYQSDLTLSNTVLSGNYADVGGALFFTGFEGSESTGTLDHVTATLNVADRHGSVLRAVWTDLTVTNSLIAWQYDGEAISVDTGTSTYTQDDYTVMYNNVMGDWYGFDDPPVPTSFNPGLAAISDDGDWTNEDWTLVDGAGAIDAGDPTSPSDTDGSLPDLGAFGGPEGDWAP